MALSANTAISVTVKDALGVLIFIAGVGVTIGQFKSALDRVDELRTSVQTLDISIRLLEHDIASQSVTYAKELGEVKGDVKVLQTKTATK